MEDEIEYLNYPRFIDGVNLDIDITAGHPTVTVRQINEPVNDGSLGVPTYAPGSTNKDGSSF